MESFVRYPDYLKINPCALEPSKRLLKSVMAVALLLHLASQKVCVFEHIYMQNLWQFRNPHAGLTLVMVYLVVQDLL